MQKKIIPALIGICLLIGCKEQESPTTERVVNVEIVKIQEKQIPITVNHNGILSAEQVKSGVFKIPGRINQIHIHKGEQVKKGQVLISLNTSEYQLGYDNAFQIEQKAKKAYEEAQRFYGKLTNAKQAGGISITDYEKAQLDMEVKKADYEQAKINTALQKKQLNDCHLKADMDGTVLDIYPNKGELVDAGTLILNMRSNTPVAEISVNAEELQQISLGDSAKVKIGNKEYQAKVSVISEMPNLETLTYALKLNLKDYNESFYVGIPLTSCIYTGSSIGICIPITAVSSDGEDYVFCVSEGRAIRKGVEITAIYDKHVKVSGLTNGDILITKGIKNIQPGIKVNL